MKNDIKRKWAKALRSGQYKQTRSQMRRIGPYGGYSYCCLGVLTALYVEDHEVEHREEQRLYCRAYLKNEVVKWAGLEHENPILDPGADQERATNVNDVSEKTFEEIADLIETNL